MKRTGRVLAVALALIGVFRLAAGGAGTGDLILFDAPRGAWLATVRAEAPLTVVEERDGWRRVRLEGWTAAAGSGVQGGTGPVGTTSGPARGPAGGTVVRGVLLAADDAPAPAGAGLIVMLLADLETLEREHGKAGEECRARVGEVTDRLERLRVDLDKALNSTDNFREAAQKNDRLKARIKEAEKDRADRIRACRQEADAILERHAVQKTISDARGAFEFSGVAPGRYRVAATEPGGDPPRAWLLDCAVTGDRAVVLDPRHDRSGVDPYWGMR